MLHNYSKVVVCGAGVMGAQIAAHLANVGLSVALLDLASDQGDRNLRANMALKQLLKMKPAPLDGADAILSIQPGNFDDHIDLVEQADWVIEAVVENLEIKRNLLKKIAQHRRGHTLVSTNTSGIPLYTLCEGLDEKFLTYFFGVHFFNPPRYLKLLEVIPGPKTDPALLKSFCEFGRIQLGKGIVVAKDTPNFIGNRIGIYAMCQSISAWTQGKLGIEEIDFLTGPLLGRPKSATFRTADVVGLDTFVHVANNLFGAVDADDEREVFKVPDTIKMMIEKELLGSKVGKGFYAKIGKEIRVIDPTIWEYKASETFSHAEILPYAKESNLIKRLQGLYLLPGKAGEFIRQHLLALFAYSAKRIPEISDDPESIDLAMKFGFGWELGPFEMWDAIGLKVVYNDLVANGANLPDWLHDMIKLGHTSFVKKTEAVQCYQPMQQIYQLEKRSCDEWNVADLKRRSGNILFEHEAATLYDIGDSVALFSFKTKANAFNAPLIQAFSAAIRHVVQSDQIKGMVVANDGDLFSAGADLLSIVQSLGKGDFKAVEQLIVDFQNLGQMIHYSPKPIVFSVHGRALGGGLEMLMACPQAVVTSELYVGLVELGVGLIPAGGGCLRLVQRAMDLANSTKVVDVAKFVEQHFLAIAQARVSTGVADAMEVGFLPKSTTVVRHADRRMQVAKAKVEYLHSVGYRSPRVKTVLALGAPAYAKLMTIVGQYVEAGFATEYDGHLCSQVAKVMTGGDFTSARLVPEQVLLDLERQAFMRLVVETKTRDRIESMLVNKKPLRN